VVLRDMPSHQFEDKKQVVDNTKIKVWKRWLEADHVLKVNDRYLFVEVVPEIEFQEIKLEEENETSN
jgi:hypothetical protein